MRLTSSFGAPQKTPVVPNKPPHFGIRNEEGFETDIDGKVYMKRQSNLRISRSRPQKILLKEDSSIVARHSSPIRTITSELTTRRNGEDIYYINFTSKRGRLRHLSMKKGEIPHEYRRRITWIPAQNVLDQQNQDAMNARMAAERARWEDWERNRAEAAANGSTAGEASDSLQNSGILPAEQPSDLGMRIYPQGNTSGESSYGGSQGHGDTPYPQNLNPQRKNRARRTTTSSNIRNTALKPKRKERVRKPFQASQNHGLTPARRVSPFHGF